MLLYFGQDPVDVSPGVPRRELTLESLGSEGPQEPDEKIFSSYLGHTTGAPDDFMNFSTTTLGFQYDSKKYKYGLYAVPETAGVTSTEIVDGKIYDCKWNYRGYHLISPDFIFWGSLSYLST